jgi:hypothetical protein
VNEGFQGVASRHNNGLWTTVIRTETVFILGAGASRPYGLPTGQELVDSLLSIESSDASGNPRFRALIEAGARPDEIREFQRSLQRSQQDSVDAFLEHRKDFIKVGKLAIAVGLLPSEIPDCLNERNSRTGGRSWYRMLLNMAMEAGGVEEFASNRVAFVTFNYDRSLEHFLFLTLAERYHGATQAQVAASVQKIPVIHVHGQLGWLPWQDAGGNEYIEYGASYCEPRNLQRAANGIKIISEITDADGSPEFQQARECIRSADHIYFLGFGFHHENVSRLKVPFSDGHGNWPGSKVRTIRGTCLGATGTQRQVWMQSYAGMELGDSNHKIDEFLAWDDWFLRNNP